MQRLLMPLLVAGLLTGCAAARTTGDVAKAPLNDLNLVQADIPPVLLEARKAPYAVPADPLCDTAAAGIAALDAVLGPDLDAPPSADNPGLLERGGDAATGALRGAAQGVVPFRGFVRKLSGAERYTRNVEAAIVAGTVRRAFLKGLAQAHACSPPATPATAPPAT
jgi:hypothetical protein